MDDTADRGTPEIADAPARPKGRPGRKPKGSVPVVIPETPDKPDPDHVLTWRQRKVLQVIRDSVQKRGYPPSMREIGEAVGLTSTSSVSYQLSTLQRKGYLHRDVGRPRTVEVRLPGHPAVRPEQSPNGAAAEAEAADVDGPKPLPAQVLDRASGYLLAYGAMAALLRQRRDGGSWQVRVSLAQTGYWLRSLGRVADGLRCKDPALDDVRDCLEESASGFGKLSAVRHPATLSETPPRSARPSVPLGTHPPHWL